jgi:hypothetical protein
MFDVRCPLSDVRCPMSVVRRLMSTFDVQRLMCSVANIRLKSPALEGRQIVAPGKSAKRTQPGVTIRTNPLFRHSPPVKANDEKAWPRPATVFCAKDVRCSPNRLMTLHSSIVNRKSLIRPLRYLRSRRRMAPIQRAFLAAPRKIFRTRLRRPLHRPRHKQPNDWQP